MLRELRAVIAVGESERRAGRAQLSPYRSEAAFDFGEGPLPRLARQDRVGQAVGAYRKTPPGQIPRLLPGHWPGVVRFAVRCEPIAGTGAIQAFGQEIEGQLFQGLNFKSVRAVAEVPHQLVTPVKPQASPGRERLGGHIKDGRHAPQFQLRRNLREMVALAVIEREQAKGPVTRPEQPAWEFFKADKVEPPAQCLQLQTCLTPREGMSINNDASPRQPAGQRQKKRRNKVKHFNHGESPAAAGFRSGPSGQRSSPDGSRSRGPVGKAAPNKREAGGANGFLQHTPGRAAPFSF